MGWIRDGVRSQIHDILEEGEVVVVHIAGLIKVGVTPGSETIEIRVGLACILMQDAVVTGVSHAIAVAVELLEIGGIDTVVAEVAKAIPVGIGLVGMEFATIFTNAYLPELHPDPDERGRISGDGWAFGYAGGVLALIAMIALFQSGANGRTMAGLTPLFGLDPVTKADTRIVGPLAAIWYAVFMIPFFLYVRDTPKPGAQRYRVGAGLSDLLRTLRGLPKHPSLLAYLGSSMFYRDALNGMYTFGGVYALGVLDWSIQEIGIFGILAAISGAVFCVLGGRIDRRIGPMPVIVACCIILVATACLIISLGPNSVMGVSLPEGSALPDILFYVAGASIGAAGGALQASSRNMLTRQGNPERMTEAFGLYALSGKATSFLAPALIALASDLTGSQRLGITPVVGLFIVGLILLAWVKPKGDFAT